MNNLQFYTMSGHNVAEAMAVKVLEQAAKAITISQVKRLAGRGSMLAVELLEGRKPETMEDLQSETKLYLLQKMVDGVIYFNDLIVSEQINADNKAEAMRLLFADDAVKLEAFRTVDNYLYSERKHSRKGGASLDDEEAQQVADPTAGVEFGAVEADFRQSLSATQAIVFDALVAGYKQAEICERCNLSNGTASRMILSVKAALIEYIKA